MKKTTSSIGKCIFCGKSFPKISLTRHLNNHLEENGLGVQKGYSFHVKIEAAPGWGDPRFFLNIWVDGKTSLIKIDSFLRQIWLECCGHMSAFRFPRQQQSPVNFFNSLAKGNPMGLGEFGEIPFERKAKDIFHKDLKLEYEYDFGSTTKLKLTVLAEYETAASQPLLLLSRNEPLPLLCETCKLEPATQMCSVCIGNEDGYFCDACAKKHSKTCEDFLDYAAMPVVNSPRMGVCAYNGGTIDTERDGVFVKV